MNDKSLISMVHGRFHCSILSIFTFSSLLKKNDIVIAVLQMVQCAAIYPEKDWPSNEGSDMEGNVNLLNAMTKRSFCPRAFTWNPSLRTCLPTLAVSLYQFNLIIAQKIYYLKEEIIFSCICICHFA